MSWSPDALTGCDVLVVGMARSGIAAARLLQRRGARVVATDTRTGPELAPEVEELEQAGVVLELGGHRAQRFTSAGLVVVSPGVPWDLAELVAARRAGVPVVGELELGYRCAAGTVVAVTGTKGKSTTAAALGAMLREAAGPQGDVRVAGNIGAALTGLVAGSTDETTFVLEASSFQLEGTEAFHPHVAIFLNLEPDHIDRHGSFERYAQAKSRIFRNQTERDWAVVNADDPGVLALAKAGRGRLLPFSAAEPARADGAFFAGGGARLRLADEEQTLFPERSIRLPGRHLAVDLLAAGAAARLLGAAGEALTRAVNGFSGSEHVLERVAEIDGVAYFDDSKATNVAAARRGLEAFDTRVIAILGGRSKGADFRALREPLAARARAAILIGEAAAELELALRGAVPTMRCQNLEEAVDWASAAAGPGDVVLLSPACASFDMFRDYAERGRAFKRAVRALGEARAGSRG